MQDSFICDMDFAARSTRTAAIDETVRSVGDDHANKHFPAPLALQPVLLVATSLSDHDWTRFFQRHLLTALTNLGPALTTGCNPVIEQPNIDAPTAHPTSVSNQSLSLPGIAS